MSNHVISRFFAPVTTNEMDRIDGIDGIRYDVANPTREARLRTFAEVARERRAPKLAPIDPELKQQAAHKAMQILVPKQPLRHHRRH